MNTLSAPITDTQEETVFLKERTHWVFPIITALFVVFLSLPCYLLAYLLFLYHLCSFRTLLFFSLLLFVFLCCLLTKIYIDWCFHVYIVTSKKIMEIIYSPLFFYRNNDVLLEQVRCTEIDEKRSGIFQEVFDIGDVTITFDRPTHQEELTLRDIKNPQGVARKLRSCFASFAQEPSDQIWYKRPSAQLVTRRYGVTI